MAKTEEKIDSLIGVQNLAEEYITYGYSCDKIIQLIKSKMKEECGINYEVLTEIVTDTCNDYPDYALIQKIMRSKLVADVESDRKLVYIVDTECKSISTISFQVLNSLFNKKINFKGKLYNAKLDYRPDIYDILSRDKDGLWVFNTYNPPFWLTDHFFSGGDISVPKVSKLPEVYDKFFRHLFDDHEKSYNYVIDWLTNAVRSRNYCILCTIGARGIGKGILGNIMEALFGEENYKLTGNRVLSSNFNAQLKNRKLVYLDEITVGDTKEEDALKLLVNDSLEIEQKGIDAKVFKNFASIYLSSNNLDSIKLSGDQRRFSIVDLTTKRLLEVMSIEEIKSLTHEDNIRDLAYYLFHREYDEREMLRVFVSERTQRVREHSLNTWQEWLLFEYAPDNLGKQIKLSEITEVIENHFGARNRPGRPALIKLEERFPEHMSVKKIREDKKQLWVVDFKDPYNAKVQVRK